MKIQFFWFNLESPVGMSVGVSILSKELMEQGHKVSIMHLNERIENPFDLERINKEIEKFNPDIFALSYGSDQVIFANKMISFLNENYPDKFLICGGIYPTIMPEEVIFKNGVDAIFIGEGDRIFVEFLNKFEKNNKRKSFPNFWFKNKKEIIRNEITYLPDIRNQTILNFELIDYRKLIQYKSKFAETIASRGCPLKCSFCQNDYLINLYNKGVKDFIRKRDVDNLIEELRIFKKVCGEELKGIVFGDDNFVSERIWSEKFVEEYKTHIVLPFIINVTPQKIDDDFVRLIEEAGCNVVRLGIEVGNERIRKSILNKPYSNKMIIKAVNILKSYGINIQGFGMFGIPGETEDDILSLFKFAAELKLDAFRLASYYPLPKTKLYKYYENNRLFPIQKTVGKFGEDSILKWNPQRKIFLEKIRIIYPWLLNIYLDNNSALIYKRWVDKIMSCNIEEWETMKNKISEIEFELTNKCKTRNIEHYFRFIPDRSDYVFLYTHKRIKKLINVDDKI